MGSKKLKESKEIGNRNDVFEGEPEKIMGSELMSMLEQSNALMSKSRIVNLTDEELKAGQKAFDEVMNEAEPYDPIADAKQKLGEIEYELVILKNRYEELENIKQETVNLIWQLSNKDE